MNKVMLVGRLTRDPELRSLPSGKHVATFTVATNEFRGGGGERTEYHPCVAWDNLNEFDYKRRSGASHFVANLARQLGLDR